MTEKKPQVGEWWVHESDSEFQRTVVFIAAINPVTGNPICVHADGEVEWDDGWEGWHHEPDCTGWNWEKPDWVTQDRVPARPGIDQRRWVCVKTGEVKGSLNDWRDAAAVGSHMHGLEICTGHRLELRCLRKDLPPVQETWPKYYSSIEPRYYPFVRRISKTHYMPVKHDGTDGFRIPNEWTDSDNMKREQITESEALSRIVKPVEPQPVKVFATVDGILYTAQEKHQPMHTYLGNLVLEERTHGEAG